MQKIMFSDEYGLTQAVLDGLKTMTRRIVTYPLKFRGVRARTHKYYLGNTFNMWHETDHMMKCNKVETIKSSN